MSKIMCRFCGSTNCGPTLIKAGQSGVATYGCHCCGEMYTTLSECFFNEEQFSTDPSFMHLCLAGEEQPENIDKYISMWFKSDMKTPFAVYLGLSTDEYIELEPLLFFTAQKEKKAERIDAVRNIIDHRQHMDELKQYSIQVFASLPKRDEFVIVGFLVIAALDNIADEKALKSFLKGSKEYTSCIDSMISRFSEAYFGENADINLTIDDCIYFMLKEYPASTEKNTVFFKTHPIYRAAK